MSKIKKTLLEGVEIKQSPAIVEFLEWYEDNSILTESEAEGTEGSIIEQDTISDIVDFFNDNKHYDEIAREESLVDVFAKVLAKMVDDSVYNAFQAVTELDCDLGDISSVDAELTSLSHEDLDEATKYYGAFQTLSDEETVAALSKIAIVIASPELDSLLTEMTQPGCHKKIAAYMDGSEDPEYKSEYSTSYKNMGVDKNTLAGIMSLGDLVASSDDITVTDLYIQIIQTEHLYVSLFDENGDATFSDDNVTKIMKEFNAVEVNESIEDSISRGLAKLQEQSKHLSRATKKKSSK